MTLTEALKKDLQGSCGVTILGYFGGDNLGDDIMLRALIDELKQSCGMPIRVVGYAPIPWLEGEVHVDVWKNNWTDNYAILRANLEKSSHLLWGGGTCFTDEDLDGGYKQVLFAKKLGKKVAYVGVGVGNLKKLERQVKTFILINRADYLSLRDVVSYQRARRFCVWNSSKLEQVEDLSYGFLQQWHQNHATQTPEHPYLLVAWRNLAAYGVTNRQQFLASVGDYIVKRSQAHQLNRIILIDTDSQIDPEMNEALLVQLKQISDAEMQVEYDATIHYDEKLKLIASSSAIVTSRLHVAVAAHFFDKPCYAYNYSPKIGYFIDEVKNPQLTLIPIAQLPMN
jgi:polysaccharide pyruvyl transferase WcaK-like protein